MGKGGSFSRLEVGPLRPWRPPGMDLSRGARHWQRARPRPGKAQRQWIVNCVVLLSCWGSRHAQGQRPI